MNKRSINVRRTFVPERSLTHNASVHISVSRIDYVEPAEVNQLLIELPVMTHESPCGLHLFSGLVPEEH